MAACLAFPAMLMTPLGMASLGSAKRLVSISSRAHQVFAVLTIEQGAGGGSEQWEHHVAMWFSTQWSDQTETPVPPEYLEEFLNKFRPQKGQSTDSRKSVSMICPFTRDYMDSHSGFLLQLSVEDIQHTWRKGLERPLNVAARQMERLADMAKTDSERVPNPVVVVSGGTARNPAVKSHMMDLGERHEIPIVFTDNFVGLTYE